MGLACARRLAAMVDTLLLVDMDEVAVTAAAGELASAAGLASAGHQAAVEPFVLDVTDRDGLARLAGRVKVFPYGELDVADPWVLLDFRGEQVTAADVTFRPVPLQRPRPPVWIGCNWPSRRPLRRAARSTW
jgi:hypothetical protein